MAHWFALYYVPPADDPLYRLGTQVLGYDVRAEAEVSLSGDLEARLGPVPPAWTAAARDFGFHLSVTEALTFDPDDLGDLEREVAAILGSFSPESEMTLEPLGLEIWKENTVWVLRYRASRALELLQAVMVARLAAFGKRSLFFDEIAEHPERYARPYERQRLQTFLSPRGLDTWEPHFTLLNPHPPEKNPALARGLETVFGDARQLRCQRFCLMLKEDGRKWRVGREYAWPPECGAP